ncbi:arylsulfatase [Saccharomonospora sp. NPDC046836]|uniref:arylsulfatase n=1 Tax=Saccharomonospora sp. NPDC046836 TaxID=3156921 RepID=UPI0033F94088
MLGRPPAAPGSPNILIVLTDDVGFGASSAFGGPIDTPVMDALSREGLRYNQFHTTAMCSPTRAALLTGRNHHSVNTGALTNMATDVDGYSSVIPESAPTIGHILRAHGYNTAWLGKNHNTPDWEITPAGPFDRWPTGMGFDYFYGFQSAATSQFRPTLISGTTPIAPPEDDPDYTLDRDLADHAIDWLRLQSTLTPDRPFLLYLAPGTAHSPHQAPKDWIERYAGRFDQGWDQVRAETFERQKAMGIVPADTRMSPRPDGIPAWDSLTPEQRKLATRMMEVHAAQLSHFEHQLGRVLGELERAGRLENTVVFYIQGDNGASAEGGPEGSVNDYTGLNGVRVSLEDMLAAYDDLGGPLSFANYPSGWAWAMNTPFKWQKRVASHFGGTRNGLVVSWPARLREHGGQIRSQFHHVVDIAPTIYEIAGITPGPEFPGIEQQPIEGVSMCYAFEAPDAPGRHREQYFELLGNRAYYKDGWIASTRPEQLPWQETQSSVPPEDYEWELYHVDRDFAQADDLAAADPDRLAELRKDFDAAAERYHIYPLSAQWASRLSMHNRPYVFNGRPEITLYGSEIRYFDQSFPDIKNRSWELEADLVVSGMDSGTIITQGGWMVGWGLFLFDGVPTFLYKAPAAARGPARLAAAAPLGQGSHVVRVRFDYDGGGRGKGGDLTLEVDGEHAGRCRLTSTTASLFGGEGGSIGRSYGTPICADYDIPFRATCDIKEIRLTLADREGAP